MIHARLIQSVMRGVAKIINIPQPQLYVGAKLFHKVIDIAQYHEISNILIVTDKNLIELKIIEPLLNLLKQNNIEYFIYDGTQVNPTITNLEEAKTSYLKHQCQAILGIGGGSPMDCAKGAAALLASGKKVSELKGLLKVRKKPPLMIMMPTTAGTGSEGTVAVVVSNPKTKEKYAISDPVLVPQYAILDAALTIGLPAHITASTGMDAMTHAIEATLGQSNTSFTLAQSKLALTLIQKHLINAFQNPTDLNAREGMLRASYHAGLAFTRAYVGYVHGIAHTLGGFYQTPHGLANAIILPHVLEAYGKTIHPQLAMMSDWLNLTSEHAPEIVKAKAFKEWILHHLKTMKIENTLPGVIQKNDIPLMIARVKQEVIPFYPVPIYLSNQVLHNIYMTLGEF
ncbi:MAG: iron-containing alcohol dehydrogenase [Bacilli bacterium]